MDPVEHANALVEDASATLTKLYALIKDDPHSPSLGGLRYTCEKRLDSLLKALDYVTSQQARNPK